MTDDHSYTHRPPPPATTPAVLIHNWNINDYARQVKADWDALSAARLELADAFDEGADAAMELVLGLLKDSHKSTWTAREIRGFVDALRNQLAYDAAIRKEESRPEPDAIPPAQIADQRRAAATEADSAALSEQLAHRDARIERLEANLVAAWSVEQMLRGLLEWRPIESAPKDGRAVMLWTQVGTLEIGQWDRLTVFGGEYWDWCLVGQGGSSNLDRHTFTHWRPMPDSPAAGLPSISAALAPGRTEGLAALRSHKWSGLRRGGDPTDAGSCEYVRYCEVCGMEDTCEDPLPPCPGVESVRTAGERSDTERLNKLERLLLSEKVGNGLAIYPIKRLYDDRQWFSLQELGDEDGSNLGDEIISAPESLRAAIDALKEAES